MVGMRVLDLDGLVVVVLLVESITLYLILLKIRQIQELLIMFVDVVVEARVELILQVVLV